MGKQNEVLIHIKTNKVGSEMVKSTGFSKEEWSELDEDEKQEIINERAWESIDCWVTGDE